MTLKQDLQNLSENSIQKEDNLFLYNVEHWVNINYFSTQNYECWAEDSEHAISQCMDHYKSDNSAKEITITNVYKILK